MTDALIRAVGSLIPVIVSLLAARGIVHLFQLESYQFPGFFRSLKRNPVQALAPGISAAATSFLLYAVYQQVQKSVSGLAAFILLTAVFLAVAAAAGLLIARILKLRIPKKPFVVTARVK